MAEAVILGSGTSTGVPVVGRSYSDAFLSDPRNHRMRSALLLKGPTGNVLVDAGADIRAQLLRHQVMSLDAVIITHTHADHIFGLDDLRPFCMEQGEPLPLYTAPEYQEDIRRIFPYAFMTFPSGIWVPKFELLDVPQPIEAAGLEIRSFWVEHGSFRVLGLRVNDFAYITDVSRIPEAAEPFLKDLDILVIDAVRHRPHPNHFHLEKAIQESQRIGAKRTFFTHLSDDFDHATTEASLPEGMKLAYDGLILDI